MSLIHSFIDDAGNDGVCFEPYPISLRGINWIKFLTLHGVIEGDSGALYEGYVVSRVPADGGGDAAAIQASLLAQYRCLLDTLEYHLMGNHLLENGFSLLFGGVYFDDERFSRKAEKILRAELVEQILDDGGHFERSPMYHQIILSRVLDCINLLRNYRVKSCQYMKPLLEEKAARMLGWLRQMTFRDGSIPLVNDAAYGIAPASEELFNYAARLGIRSSGVAPLRESGYRKISNDSYEAILDVGDIGPDYIPGHAHSDTFNFVLHVSGKPLIVDTGTSTYENNSVRHWQRSTKAHNTVQIGEVDQSEVWGSFRVARRAYVKDLEEGENSIIATHTGYARIGASHRRRFEFNDQEIRITDIVDLKKPHDCTAFLHFHPEVRVQLDQGSLLADGCRIICADAERIELQDYEYAPEFNRLIPAKMAVIRFKGKLETVLHLA